MDGLWNQEILFRITKFLRSFESTFLSTISSFTGFGEAHTFALLILYPQQTKSLDESSQKLDNLINEILIGYLAST